MSQLERRVQSWRRDLQLPVARPMENEDEPPVFELLVGPDSVRFHNLQMLRNDFGEELYERLTAEYVRSSFQVAKELDFNPAASEGLLVPKLNKTLRGFAETRKTHLELVGDSDNKIELLLTVDERVSFNKIVHILYTAGQAGLRHYELLTRSPSDRGLTASTTRSNLAGYSRIAVDTPMICTPSNADGQSKTSPCLTPVIYARTGGQTLTVETSQDWGENGCAKMPPEPGSSGAESVDATDASTSDDSSALHRLDGETVKLEDGNCPMPSSPDQTVELIRALNETRRICNHATVSGDDETPWGHIAPNIATLKSHTSLEYVTVSVSPQTPPTCEDAISVTPSR